MSASTIASGVDKSRTSIVVFGAAGRMGSRIAALGANDPSIDLRACVVRAGSVHLGERLAAFAPAPSAGGASGPPPGGPRVVTLETAENAGKTAVSADVVIDFSSDASARESLALAERLNAALLVGTTALTERTLTMLRAASDDRAVLVAPNTSLGVAVLSVLVARACRALGDSYQLSIVEAHHAAKKDAPSGTALRLAQAARDAGHDVRDDQILAMRGGDVVGEHTVRLAGAGEYIELTHRATTRDLFARGALRAAHWLRSRRAGWYTMHDVVDLPA